MIDLNNKIINEEKRRYSEDQVQKTLDYLNSFVEKVNKLYVSEDGKKRILNQLEIFVCIYDFVTQRKYNKKPESQDIIGALNNDCFVCLSFAKMIKILCDEFNIPCMIKYSKVETWRHANNEVVLKDKLNHLHLLHVDATIDCINHSKLNIGGFTEYYSVTRINGLLIADEDIDKYYRQQHYLDFSEQSAYFRLINKIEPNKLFEVTEEDEFIYESYIEMMINSFEHLIPNIIEMCGWFDIKEEFSTETELIETYGKLLKTYQNVTVPIADEEMLEAMYNAYAALLTYENNNDIDYKTNLLLLKKIQLSLEFQLKNYNNENGKSFMFKMVNKINNK